MSDNISVFAESCLPVLQGGGYMVQVTQRTESLGNSVTETQMFYVEGPRFSLDAQDVLSVYPPAGMSGGFGLTLPHIVLARKTLPWERALQPQEAEERAHDINAAPCPARQAPFLALLLFCEEEIPDVKTGIAREALNPIPGVFIPALNCREAEQTEPCRYIDVSAKLFLGIAPLPDELTLLCHARQVDPTLKALNASADDVWNAIVVCNRLPVSTGSGARARACLVSLEGYGQYEKKALGDYDKVRLFVLYSWDFISVTSPFSLKQLFEGLSIGAATLPADNKKNQGANILRNGYVPLPHTLRNGDTTLSLYRGPFAPLRPDNAASAADSADKNYRYDPAAGLFDVSHAVAWQQGRLLALANKSVAVKLMRLRRKNRHTLQRLHTRRALQRCFGLGVDEDGRVCPAVLDCLEDRLDENMV